MSTLLPSSPTLEETKVLFVERLTMCSPHGLPPEMVVLYILLDCYKASRLRPIIGTWVRGGGTRLQNHHPEWDRTVTPFLERRDFEAAFDGMIFLFSLPNNPNVFI